MPDLLLELFSEEIPARMQIRAAEDLSRLVTDRLVAAGLTYEGARRFATPRRLTLHIAGVPARSPDVREERKGPRVGAPEAAVQGFLKSAGLASLDQAERRQDPKKGEFYVATLSRPGRPAVELIAEIVPEVIRDFPWPKSMRWGPASADTASLRWVRPLHSILCTFGPETEEPETVRFTVDGIAAGDITHGHRFMAPQPIRVRRLDDYERKLHDAKVVLDPERRRDIILHDAKDLAFAQGYELVEDEGLLAEVSGLVEWPVVLMGRFDPAFLEVPPEVIQTTIRANQKCFVVRDPETGRLADRFVLTANIEAADGGRAIVAGNERVIRARLSDAKFFWEQDMAVPLAARLPKLGDIVFHEKLGTEAERVERLKRLARELARRLGADPDKAERAAELAKADLVSDMVGEFPELQGLMGRYYAAAQGEDPSVARAIEDHYKPQGPSDRVPSDPVSVSVALADKLDTLVGFWAIGEKPTGSKDPYALRRAALGIIRIVLDNGIRLALSEAIRAAALEITASRYRQEVARDRKVVARAAAATRDMMLIDEYENLQERVPVDEEIGLADDLLAFFADRLKVHLREQGARHDLIDAVFSLGGQDDLLMILRRIEALGRFLDTEDGRNLLAGVKRATNILRIEEKKDGVGYDAPPDPALYAQAEERALAEAIDRAKSEASAAVAHEDFEAAMRALARLRPAVDAFFDRVTVNAEDAKLRANRLRLLNQIRQATRTVADFSKVEA